jgi:hypothetical protein
VAIVVRGRDQRPRLAAEKFADHRCGEIEGAAFPVAPNIEDESPAGPQYAAHLAKAGPLVREKHDPELAQHTVERAIRKRQRKRVRLLPLHALQPRMRFRAFEHRRVQIGRRDCDLTGQ